MAITKITRDALNTGIDDNSDATAITIDSSEHVRVGTPGTPTRPFEVKGHAVDNIIARFESNNTAATYQYLEVTDANAGTGAVIFGFNPGSALNNTNSYGFIGMGGDNVNGGVGMHLHKGGVVTTPSQPSFTVNGVAAVSTTPGNSQVLNFSTVILNNGNHFNISQDRFVAPVAGHYFFSYSCMTTTQSHTSNIVIRRNGSGRHSSYVKNDTYLRHNIAVVEYLAVNDYVDIVLEHGGVHGGFDHFSGFLIG